MLHGESIPSRLPCQGDKDVCGSQVELFQFHAKNPSRKFVQTTMSGTASMR